MKRGARWGPRTAADHLRGADDSDLIVLARDDDGALGLEVEVLLATHAHLPLHHHLALLPSSVYVPQLYAMPKTLHDGTP